MASAKPMNIYMTVGVTAFPIIYHVKKKQNKKNKAKKTGKTNATI